MAKLTILNADPKINGEYEIDLAAGFTKAEYFLMKKHVGVVVNDLMPGAPVDANVLTAWGLVLLARDGKEAYFPHFMQTRDDQTVWEFPEDEVGDDEGDAVPPANEPLSGSGDVVRLSERNENSGRTTSDDSDDSPETSQPLTGSPPSAASAH